MSEKFKVGDEVMIHEVIGGSSTATVEKVGRKYVTVDGLEYEIATGRWNNKHYGYHRACYTMAEWDRKKKVEAYLKAVRRYAEVMTSHKGLQSLSEIELEAETLRLNAWADQAANPSIKSD